MPPSSGHSCSSGSCPSCAGSSQRSVSDRGARCRNRCACLSRRRPRAFHKRPSVAEGIVAQRCAAFTKSADAYRTRVHAALRAEEVRRDGYGEPSRAGRRSAGPSAAAMRRWISAFRDARRPRRRLDELFRGGRDRADRAVTKRRHGCARWRGRICWRTAVAGDHRLVPRRRTEDSRAEMFTEEEDWKEFVCSDAFPRHSSKKIQLPPVKSGFSPRKNAPVARDSGLGSVPLPLPAPAHSKLPLQTPISAASLALASTPASVAYQQRGVRLCMHVRTKNHRGDNVRNRSPRTSGSTFPARFGRPTSRRDVPPSRTSESENRTQNAPVPAPSNAASAPARRRRMHAER